MKDLKNLIEEANEIIPKISCKTLTESKNQCFVLDVREGSEVIEKGAIDNSVNIPRGLVEMKLAPDASQFPAETPIVVYCGGGSRAALAGKTLVELGFTNVRNLDGGYRAWEEFSS
jgi:rhodanese-related sulfurtransferase